MRLYMLLAAATALCAQQPLDPTERLARARQILVERDKRLPDYTCVQTIDRQYFKRRHTDAPFSCAQAHSADPRDLVLESTDRVRLDIKVSQGTEIGSWAGGQFSSRSIFDLVGEGPYGTGMLGSMLMDIFMNGGATYQYAGGSAYSYQVPFEASHYRIKAGSGWEVTAFHGTFWLDSNSADLTRVVVDTTDLPPETGACEDTTTVDYQKVRVGGGEFLLPRESTMRQVLLNGAAAQITAVYSGCRAYSSEATIRFDEAPAPAATEVPAAPATALPDGVRFSLALAEPIDTDTAAAGDIVRAKLRRTVRDPHSKAILMPAGAMVEGRIVGMQHWLSGPRYFMISMLLEKLESGGTSRPLYAKLDSSVSPEPGDVLYGTVSITDSKPPKPQGQPGRVAAFPFMTDQPRYRVPAGYASDWITVSPPPAEEK